MEHFYYEKLINILNSQRFIAFTQYDKGFLKDLKSQWDDKGVITEAQRIKLCQIHEQYFG